MNKITILAIESSCDDTSAAVISNGSICSNYIANQTIHKEYGGVVPEVASRAHLKNIIPVVDQALKKAGVEKKELDAIAFTRGPGLIGSLLVGLSFAKTMALSLKIPIIEVNHIQAHVLAHFIDDPVPELPFLCLTVSGGHTQIVLVKDHLDMEIIGSTIDDAAGEAFDKSGKLLGLDYPAGPLIDKLAKEGKAIYSFTEPNVPEFDFSFSGLKTNILRFLEKNQQKDPNFIRDHLPDICASVQTTIVEILMKKLILASEKLGIRDIAIAGGVSANSQLRSRLYEIGDEKNWNVFIPKFEYCTDNAAMIAMTAHFKYQKGLFADQAITPLARYPFKL